MTIAASTAARSVPHEGFEQWAAIYEQDTNPVVALQERILRAVLPDARAKAVVDIGCGTGRILSLWSEQEPARLIGVDYSSQMLRRATRTTASLIAADCCALPLVNSTADFLSCCLTLGYVPDIDLFAAEMTRVVAQDGAVLISELHPESVLRFGWRRGFTQGERSINIEASALPIDEVVAAFGQHGFKTDLFLEVPFETSELPLFEAAGRRKQFEAFREYPALYILRLRRNDSESLTSESITLGHARVSLSATEAVAADLRISESAIWSIGVSAQDLSTCVDLSGYLLLPGLINSHDHLEFALFPRLGQGKYQNSREWAEEIYHPDESPIREHLRVPKRVRLWWGAIRNLLCGVTTVCHHNPYDQDLFEDDFPVRVVRDFAWAHSLAFDPGAVAARRRAGNDDVPFVIHAAEGTDDASKDEIYTLSQLGVLDPRTVIVHGTGLDATGFELLKECGAALVWCPSSNIFLFGQTLAADQVQCFPLAALGSDSPITSAGDLLDEIRFAAAIGGSPEMLYQLTIRQASQVLRLKHGEGRITPGAVADLIAVHDRGLSPASTLASLSYSDVALVIKGGKVRLASDAMKARLPEKLTEQLELLKVDGVRRWVHAPIRQLLELSRQALGSELTMCGRPLTQ